MDKSKMQFETVLHFAQKQFLDNS